MGRVVFGEVVLTALVVGVLVAATSAAVRQVRGDRTRRPLLGPALLDGAIAASFAAVIVATLSPLDLLGTRLDERSEVNLTLFEAMRGAPPVYAVVNAVLLVPTVVLLAQRWRRAGIVRLTLAGVAVSLAIEVAQLIHPVRGSNVDDLVLNSAGAAVAAVVGVTIRATTRRTTGPVRAAARSR